MTVGPHEARVVLARSSELIVIVPPGAEGGRMPVRLETWRGRPSCVDVGSPLATGLHHVDSPVFDRDGNLYVTFSGTRGQQAPVSIFKGAP